MTEEEKIACPKCGMLVPKSDKLCKNCGTTLIEVSRAVPAMPPAPEIVPEERHERKFSLIQRFLKVLTKPFEAMKDIGLAPDYGGAVAVIVTETVLASVAVILIFQRVQFVGTYAEEVWNFVVGIGLLGIIVAWLFTPPSLLTSQIWTCKAAIADYQAQMLGVKLAILCPCHFLD